MRGAGKGRKRQSVRTTLQIVQSKKFILELAKRLARLQDLLSFHVIMDVRCVLVFSKSMIRFLSSFHRVQVCRLKEEQSLSREP